MAVYRCAICGREDTPLLEANIKDRGPALVCPECWSKLMAENKIVMGSTGGGCACG
ncbi:MAG: hypothetical protein ACPL3C_03295 [Pyrobaculum sp.]|uniref:Uncharacterized protein n=1 Tax=Pyrobaculum ferrireducens TaxID=1104324 RepID=G7VCZ7_9CREN|nr:MULTISPECIES: hypothetical protein [Pyrobaculum]AET32686.1 hypothetical protein P186_1257 [Pyrobaculum ferrireducens]MCU7787147.1 hypothetical protein [Pyrobaculum sp. 3827-6]